MPETASTKGLVTVEPHISFPVENKALSDLGYVGTNDKMVLFHQCYEMVSQWEPKSQVFMLSWGSLICASAAGVMVQPLFR